MHFGNEDPIGRRVKISIERVPGQPAPTRQPSWVTVIAIAPTIRQRNIEEALPDPVSICRCSPKRLPTLHCWCGRRATPPR
jgi:hypothetical protein